MLDARTRKVKERILLPIASFLPEVHPNWITALSFILGFLAFIAAWRQIYGLALILWGLNRFTDGLDGTIARVQGAQTDLGGYLDILSDYIIYALVPLGIVLGDPTISGLLMLALLLAVYYVNAASWIFLAAIFEKRRYLNSQPGASTTIRMPAGLIEGTETVIFYIFFLLFPEWHTVLFGLFASLVALTVIQRAVWAWFKLK